MKKKRSHSGVITFVLLFIAFIIYIQFLEKTAHYENSELPEGLHPIVAQKAEQLVHNGRKRGIEIIITDDFRSFDEQNRLYETGRTKEGSIVTQAKGGESYHNFGLAIDFAIKKSNGEVIWDMTYDGNGNGQSDWMEVVEIAKSLGFEWGGDWKHFKDYPHLQMNFGLSIRDLNRGKRPPSEIVNAASMNN
ncbi:M15 family metallopeptidase [Bacillus sp. B15-48]|uniref:M15 family metallopeptidase n=1 Tax=Bacillus sp. B15-48 TaxID=1548601 RepID=UPI00193EF034|nr:M15 family peptidase [Bacillus sp. B15-48]